MYLLNQSRTSRSGFRVFPLHSTMYLLNLDAHAAILDELGATLHSTMYLLNPVHTGCLPISRPALHSTMYLLNLPGTVSLCVF